jgi:hypothetical protein
MLKPKITAATLFISKAIPRPAFMAVLIWKAA